MSKLPVDKVKKGEPLVRQAVEALQRYHEAQGIMPADEVERLRLEAEALFTAVSEYQRRALGEAAPSMN